MFRVSFPQRKENLKQPIMTVLQTNLTSVIVITVSISKNLKIRSVGFEHKAKENASLRYLPWMSLWFKSDPQPTSKHTWSNSSPTPGASISHTKSQRQPYAQIELFLELFPVNVFPRCGPHMAEINVERDKNGWEGCGTSLWPPFIFQRWVRSDTNRSGDRSSPGTHV